MINQPKSDPPPLDPREQAQRIAEKPKLRDPLEIINSSSRLKLPADPQPDMIAIGEIARVCIRHHPTLALSTWQSSIRQIREALENIEDIYDRADEGCDRR